MSRLGSPPPGQIATRVLVQEEPVDEVVPGPRPTSLSGAQTTTPQPVIAGAGTKAPPLGEVGPSPVGAPPSPRGPRPGVFTARKITALSDAPPS